MTLDDSRYQRHLQKVSRSFAFCIARLDRPFRDWVGLAYLLCRVVDTIEDAVELSVEQRQKAFLRFDQWALRPPLEEEVNEWLLLFDPKSLPDGEFDLLRDVHFLFAELHLKAPASVKDILVHLIQSMSLGMQHFQGSHQLKSLMEVNQYCFFVAGLVGEALCKLLTAFDSTYPAGEKEIYSAHHFGLFLQKVNLLKDQVKDEEEGRFLVPDREILRASVLGHAQEAWRFLESLPSRHQAFRVFCAWSLFLGLVSLPLVEKAYASRKTTKLSRIKTQWLIHKVERLEAQPKKLQNFFDETLRASGLLESSIISRAEQKSGVSPSELALPSSQDWFTGIYRGELRPEALSRLGVLV